MKLPASSRQPLSVSDAVAIVVGIVLGAGIFKTPAMVASQSGSGAGMLVFWILGGLVSLIGAMCYAELSSAYPGAGGEYQYLHRAYGPVPAFLFAWARMTVIQAGSIAMLSFLVGDYLSGIASLGTRSPSYYAVFTIIVLTALNLAGIRQGSGTQKLLLGGLIAGFFVVIFAGLSAAASGTASSARHVTTGAVGQAMVFVLLTYGGWNEAAYLSSDVRRPERNMVPVLLVSIGMITLLYCAINLAILRGLGFDAMAGSNTVAADFMRRVAGERGAQFISFLVSLAALSTINGTMITGARTSYALGKDFDFFGFLGETRGAGTPVNAFLMQGVIALMLVALGTGMRNGFVVMVEYTAPVFWFFFLLVGIALFVLRRKDRDRPRPFQVPLYPVTPLMFCGACAGMLLSSVLYAGRGAVVGVAVLLVGVPLLVMQWTHRKEKTR